MIGFSASRTTYFRTTRFSRSPLARATLICALPTISKTLPRITLIIPAIPDVPMMMIGTQIWASMSTSLATLHGASTNCDENNPPGDMPKTCMDSMMNISANRKFGVASPMNPRNVNNWSLIRYWWVAE